MFARLKASLQGWPDALLTIALLVASVVIAAIALQPDHNILKAVVLAYIIFP